MPNLLNPIEFVSLHFKNAGKALLEPGDHVYYDSSFKTTFANIALFEAAVGTIYQFKLVSDIKVFDSTFFYEIIAIL